MVSVGKWSLKTISKKRGEREVVFTCMAALVAVSNTSLTPSLLFAEHSMYANAEILPAVRFPSSVMGCDGLSWVVIGFD